MGLKVYADRMSQPSRAIIIFCKVNKIDYEEVKIELAKRQHRSAEFAKINPLKQVPAIVDGRFKLSESHAILRYLSCSFPAIPDHWYPNDLTIRAKIDSILDWHHSNLRRGSMTYVFYGTLAPMLGAALNAQATMEGEKILMSSLSKLESIWLKNDSKFLVSNFRPSIADLSLVCELMQLEFLEENDKERILQPYPKVRDWIENVKRATHPYFLEVHGHLYKMKAFLQEQRNNKVTSKL
ncbi:hypothetical protein LUZ60_002482 [Juncus effusus]|nr:hypothetical protein LUZ60_002482 [Juncus effusus]